MRPGSRLAVLTAITLVTFAATAHRAAAQEAKGDDGPAPRIVSATKDASGEHMVLALTPKGARVFAGKAGNLERLEIIDIDPSDRGYRVFTEKRGVFLFNTVDSRAEKPGGIGFLAPLTRFYDQAGDAAVIAEVEAKIGLRAERMAPAQAQAGTRIPLKALANPKVRKAIAKNLRQQLAARRAKQAPRARLKGR